MSNSEFIDSIILDLNNLIREMMNGGGIKACLIASEIVNKLSALRNSVDDTKTINKKEEVDTNGHERNSGAIPDSGV